MAWPPNSDDRRRAFEEDGAWFENHYTCHCGHTWSDKWSCAVDDDCPKCNDTISPDESEEIEFDG